MKKLLCLLATTLVVILGLCGVASARESIPVSEFPEELMDFAWVPFDSEAKKTYHDLLKEDLGNTLHEMLMVFNIGRVGDTERDSVLKKYGLNGSNSFFYYVYRLDELQQTFNAAYNTDIDFSSLDGVESDFSGKPIRVRDNYFIIELSPHGTDEIVATKGMRLNNGSEYWVWHHEWFEDVDLYTVTSHKNVAGYEIYTIDYIGFEPPSDEVLAAYDTAADSVGVTLNGTKLSFDQPPIIQNGRTLVPMRAIFEAFGAIVSWDGDTQTVIADKYGTTIYITIGENKLSKNGVEITLDVPAVIINGRTMVPVRAISEAFGCKVEWDGENRTVVITSDGVTAVEKSRNYLRRAIEVSKTELEAYKTNDTAREDLLEAVEKGEKLLTNGGSMEDIETVYRNMTYYLSNFRDDTYIGTQKTDVDSVGKTIMSIEAWGKLCDVVWANAESEISFDSEDPIEKIVYEFLMLGGHEVSALLNSDGTNDDEWININYGCYYGGEGADPKEEYYWEDAGTRYYEHIAYNSDDIDNVLRMYFNVTEAQIEHLHNGMVYSGTLNRGYYSDGYYYVPISGEGDFWLEDVAIVSAEIDESYGENRYRLKFTIGMVGLSRYDGTQYAYVKVSDDGSGFKLYGMSREVEIAPEYINW